MCGGELLSQAVGTCLSAIPGISSLSEALNELRYKL